MAWALLYPNSQQTNNAILEMYKFPIASKMDNFVPFSVEITLLSENVPSLISFLQFKMGITFCLYSNTVFSKIRKYRK